MSYGHIVYSATSVDSTSNTVNIGQHTTCLYIANLDTSTNAIVKLNGGPHQVVIPHAGQHHAYVEIPGDYTSYQVMTANVACAIYAIG